MGRINLQMGRKTTSDPLDASYVKEMNDQMKLIQENFKKVLKGVNNIMPMALEFAVEPIFDESQRLVPVDTGDLKRSGFVKGHTTERGSRVDIGYGAYNRPYYAIFVHERTDIQHQAPTQSKFLEAAVHKYTAEILPRVQQYMKNVVVGD